eukprot:768461-Hanusia_phi.AAC.5
MNFAPLNPSECFQVHTPNQKLPSIAVVKALTLDGPFGMMEGSGAFPLLRNVCLKSSLLTLNDRDCGQHRYFPLDYPQGQPTFAKLSHQTVSLSTGLDGNSLFMCQNAQHSPFPSFKFVQEVSPSLCCAYRCKGVGGIGIKRRSLPGVSEANGG